MNKLAAVIMTLLALSSCHRQATAEELSAYLADPEHGLVRKRTISDLTYTLSYIPEELFMLQSRGHNNTDSATYIYFVLRIKHQNGGQSPLKENVTNKKDYFNRQYYVQTKLRNDFSLMAGDKKLSCVFLNNEDNQNLLPEMKVLLAFYKPGSVGDMTLQYEDNLFGMGLIKFKFEKENIENIPQLKL